MDNIDLVRADWAHRVALWGSSAAGSRTALRSGNLPVIPVKRKLAVTQNPDGSMRYEVVEDEDVSP